MIDARLKNGDTVTTSSGEIEMLSDDDALFQSAMIRICAKKGEFVYDRELGSTLDKLEANAEFALEKAEIMINEALADLDNAIAVVKEIDEERLVIELTIENKTRTKEVRLDGKL